MWEFEGMGYLKAMVYTKNTPYKETPCIPISFSYQKSRTFGIKIE